MARQFKKLSHTLYECKYHISRNMLSGRITKTPFLSKLNYFANWVTTHLLGALIHATAKSGGT